MIRHISIFTFLDQPGNGKTKEENMETVRAYLEQCPSLYPPMKQTRVGVTLGGTPLVPDDAGVMFGDLIQIADFDTPEDAAGYPPSEAHTGLVELSGAMLKKVTSIDFEL